MANQQANKASNSFGNEDGLNISASGGNQEFSLQEDDRLKQEEDYRQGNDSFYDNLFFPLVLNEKPKIY